MNPEVQRAWRAVTVENARLCAAWCSEHTSPDRDEALREWREAMNLQGGALARYRCVMSETVSRLR